ncbi:winged helix-turn-helix domain-containing protein, partial [Ruminococcus sp.]
MSKLFFDSHKYFDFDTQLLYTDDIPKEEALTGIPFRILEYLAKNAPLPLSCDQIRQECWENDNGTGDVPYHISVLREYIEDIKIKGTRKYTYIVTRDKKYYCSIKLTSDFISDGTNSFITDELECDNNSVDYLISPLDYCKQRGIKGFLDSGLAPQVLIKN